VRTVLLDLDGTLADSASVIVEHLAAAVAVVGARVPDAGLLRRLVGPPFVQALPTLGLTPEQTAAAIVAFRASYDAVAATVTPLYPGVPALLERLDLAPVHHPVVMVGDRHHDVDGAAEHGVPTIGVAWGYAEPGELDGARIVVPDVTALAETLRSGGVWSTGRAA
jgi:phosphoglycolate phosphatase